MTRYTIRKIGISTLKSTVRPNSGKVKSIMNFPILKTTKEIKVFLGLTDYYRKINQDIAKFQNF